jgi:hypothetical protein
MMAEVGELLAAAQACRAAKSRWNGSEGPKQFHDTRLTVETFVKLVATGSDPVGILDLTGTGQGKPLDPTGGHPHKTGMVVGDIQQLLSA